MEIKNRRQTTDGTWLTLTNIQWEYLEWALYQEGIISQNSEFRTSGIIRFLEYRIGEDKKKLCILISDPYLYCFRLDKVG